MTGNSRVSGNPKVVRRKCRRKRNLSAREPLRGSHVPWVGAAAAVCGEGHVDRGLPCQDRALALVAPRPCLLVLDGRGSAALSHEGAEAAVHALSRRLNGLEPLLRQCLDQSSTELARVSWQGASQILYATAAHAQTVLAEAAGRRAADYEFTLSVMVIGEKQAGWLMVGDSPLVVQKRGILGVLHVPKGGDYANQTTFVRACPRASLGMAGGLISVDGLEAVVAMTDGTATRMIHLGAEIPAEVIRQITSMLVRDQVDGGADLLSEVLKQTHWREVTRDDRSLAILARQTIPMSGVVPVSRKKAVMSEEPMEPSQTVAIPVTDPSETATEHVQPSTPSNRSRLVPFLVLVIVMLVMITFFLLSRHNENSPTPPQDTTTPAATTTAPAGDNINSPAPPPDHSAIPALEPADLSETEYRGCDD